MEAFMRYYIILFVLFISSNSFAHFSLKQHEIIHYYPSLEKEYLAWSDRVVREGYNKQAKRVEKQFKTIGRIPAQFQQLTKPDLILIQNLKRQTFTQFKDVSNTMTRRISEKIYQSTLTGA